MRLTVTKALFKRINMHYESAYRQIDNSNHYISNTYKLA